MQRWPQVMCMGAMMLLLVKAAQLPTTSLGSTDLLLSAQHDSLVKTDAKDQSALDSAGMATTQYPLPSTQNTVHIKHWTSHHTNKVNVVHTSDVQFSDSHSISSAPVSQGSNPPQVSPKSPHEDRELTHLNDTYINVNNIWKQTRRPIIYQLSDPIKNSEPFKGAPQMFKALQKKTHVANNSPYPEEPVLNTINSSLSAWTWATSANGKVRVMSTKTNNDLHGNDNALNISFNPNSLPVEAQVTPVLNDDPAVEGDIHINQNSSTADAQDLKYFGNSRSIRSVDKRVVNILTLWPIAILTTPVPPIAGTTPQSPTVTPQRPDTSSNKPAADVVANPEVGFIPSHRPLGNPPIDHRPNDEPVTYPKPCQNPAAHPVPTINPIAVHKPVANPIVVPRPIPKPAAAPRPIANPIAVQRPMKNPIAVPRPMKNPIAVPRPVENPIAVPRPIENPVAVPRPIENPIAVPRPIKNPIAVPRPIANPIAVPRPIANPIAVPRPIENPIAVPRPSAISMFVPRQVINTFTIQGINGIQRIVYNPSLGANSQSHESREDDIYSFGSNEDESHSSESNEGGTYPISLSLLYKK